MASRKRGSESQEASESPELAPPPASHSSGDPRPRKRGPRTGPLEPETNGREDATREAARDTFSTRYRARRAAEDGLRDGPLNILLVAEDDGPARQLLDALAA